MYNDKKEKGVRMESNLLLIEIGERLREHRTELNITQAKAAELLSMSISFYGQIERGKRRLSLEKLVMCHSKLGIDPTYLLTGIRPLEIGVSNCLRDCPKEKRFDMEQLIRYASELYR